MEDCTLYIPSVAPFNDITSSSGQYTFKHLYGIAKSVFIVVHFILTLSISFGRAFQNSGKEKHR